MTIRSVASVAVRVLVALVALAAMFLTPVIIEGPSGRSFEPVGVVIDLVALVVLAALAWTAFGRRRPKTA